MNDPIVDIIRLTMVANNEALLNDEIPSSAIAPEAAKQIRQQIGQELLERSPMNMLAGMTASEILINKEQAYELGWNEAKQLFREVCKMEDNNE